MESVQSEIDRKTHQCINGHYVDEENVKRELFLGYGYQQALCRVNHVKSFL